MPILSNFGKKEGQFIMHVLVHWIEKDIYAKAYPKPFQISKIKGFAKTQLLPTFAKHFILDVWQRSEHTF